MNNSPFDLTGKIAFVSAASRGIGKAVAELIAQHGAHVIVSSRKLDDCQQVVDGIKAAGGSAEALACHVGNMDNITEAFEYIRDKHGRLDILINNAATNPYYGHVLDTDLGAFSKTIDVNIRGYFFMSVEAGKLMKAQGGGTIVNTSSIGAIRAGERQAIYNITKAAIVNMTKCFAKECGPLGIRVNAILPGVTKTKFAGALIAHDEVDKTVLESIPLKRYAEPEEMAGTVLYLVSNAASYVNGECVVVDGGLSL